MVHPDRHGRRRAGDGRDARSSGQPERADLLARARLRPLRRQRARPPGVRRETGASSSLTLEPGKSVTYRHRVLFLGGTTPDSIEREYKTFAATTSSAKYRRARDGSGYSRHTAKQSLTDPAVECPASAGLAGIHNHERRRPRRRRSASRRKRCRTSRGRARAPAARRQARARAHPRRHAHDADAADVRRRSSASSAPRVAALDFLVALGTHTPMSDEQLSRLVGRPVVDGRAGARRIFNHRWDDPGDVRRRSARFRRARSPTSAGGRLESGRPGRAEPPGRRVRPRAHLRAGLSARSRRVLGRHQVPVSRHRRAARSSTSRTGSAR